ncbi:MAG TPA: tetratricopeptide repeat protein [Candidatus Competibacteraceae bacterium]|nr:tetratricopeptide repeat protein [Candidatus Competibacteraceae bacterium]HRZ04670.1 tetratricopeptide repeat protein [Candidatus Competibacteraceae bacterium]HSA45015.1 tetratricopeptide repeat protein [Candidatus Competibacteraceae bacterium]
MEQYTDDERVEDLKKWWQENGVSIIVGIALGVAAIFGWRYWVSHRDAQANQASLAYDAFIEAVEKPDTDQARQRGQGLLADFPNSAYAALATLRLAKLAVDNGDQATAIQQLQWVIDHAKLAELQDIARLRLARVFFAAGQLTEAEKLLAHVNTASLTAEREELRGDLALAGNDPAKARTAYAQALAAGGASPLLRIKLDNLAVPTADTVIAAPVPPLAEPATVTVPPPVPDAPSEAPAETLSAPEAPAETPPVTASETPAAEASETPAKVPEAAPDDAAPTAPAEPVPVSPAPPASGPPS